jgi:hypothetical protein
MKEVDVDEPCTILVCPSAFEIPLWNRRTARDLKLAPVAIFEICYLSRCQETNDLGLCFEIGHLRSNADNNDSEKLLVHVDCMFTYISIVRCLQHSDG